MTKTITYPKMTTGKEIHPFKVTLRLKCCCFFCIPFPAEELRTIIALSLWYVH